MKEQTDHVKKVQDKQLNKLRQPEDREVKSDEQTKLEQPQAQEVKQEDAPLIDQAQDKVAAEFNPAELTPEQYVERTEIAAKELEGDTEVTPSEPESDRSPEQE